MKLITFLLLLLLPICVNAEFIICGDTAVQHEPALAFDGNNFFAVWSDGRGVFPATYGARITQLGNVLDTNGIRLLYEGDDQSAPSIAFNGNNYLVAWQFGC